MARVYQKDIMDRLVTALSMQFHYELPMFYRSMEGIQTQYDMVTCTYRIDVEVKLPCGEIGKFNCEFGLSLLTDESLDRAINEVASGFLRAILNEDEIKEEVAEGILPIECLDRLRRYA